MLPTDRNKNILAKYIPVEAVDLVHGWIYHFDFKLKVKKERSTRYGDYMPPVKGKNHQITINFNLNPYAFLITLVHEVAHLVAWNRHKESVSPHGKEWKLAFKELMQPFFTLNVFPEDLHSAVKEYLENPSASSCSDPELYRTLKKYDKNSNALFLEQLPHDAVFVLDGNRHFRKGSKRRTRFHCIELHTGREYFVSGLAEVKVLESCTPALSMPATVGREGVISRLFNALKV